MIDQFPPAILLFIGAALLSVTPVRWRALWVCIIPVMVLWFIWRIPDEVVSTSQFLGFQIQWIEGSPVRRLFATVFTLMTLLGGIFAFKHASTRELVSAFGYAASAIGVCFAGDLISLFIYWELMAVFSTIIVWSGGLEQSKNAGIRYAIVHFVGGVIFKVGIIGVIAQTGSHEIHAMRADDLAACMILIGVLINAAAPPFSSWLADAYPEGSPSGTVFLSAYTTKAAVLCLILLFPGEGILIPVGIFMIFYGIIYALLENDMRRILAYSIVNQVGFMVCAVGIGTEMALNGAAAHAFAHILYKALLLMSAGSVLLQTGKRKCSELGGLFQTMPITTICGTIGALAISSFPFTSGFTTKVLISVAAQEQGLAVVYFLLAAASAGVFLHAGIKFPWFVFFQKDSGMRPKDAPWNMSVSMILLSVMCIVLGVFPGLIYQYLPYPVNYQPYSAAKLVFYLQLLLFSGLAFFLMLPWMKRTMTITLDVDWVYRRLFTLIWCRLEAVWLSVRDNVRLVIDKGRPALNMIQQLIHTNGFLASTWSIGVTVLLIVMLLSVYIVVYYL